jgi:hypothetical protein
VNGSDAPRAAALSSADRSCVFCGDHPGRAAKPVCPACARERVENGYVFAPPGFGLDTCHGTNPARECTHPSHADGLPINCWSLR